MAKSSTAPQALPQMHVLLVEDNASDAFLVGNLLEESPHVHYKTHHVGSQSEAVKAIGDHHYDVCLLDLTLPDASGFSALISIQEKAPTLPVLILTGFNDTSLAKRAVGRGAQDYLLKDEIETTYLARAIDYAVERKHAEKELFQRANYDALTGLANRNMFLSRLALTLARAERSNSGVAVLFIDLDRFKPVNDIYGHDAGDEVLKTVAQRIKTVLRAYDTAARFGGDEFAMLLEGIDTPRDAATIAQKIVKELSVAIPYNGHDIHIGASIGIAFSDEDISMDILLQHADIAMYHAKKEGGTAYRFFVASMHDEAADRLNLEEDLRVALLSEELVFHYQPYINCDDETLWGVEALLRWNHPERGLLSAREFLSIAEEAKLMPKIIRWACTQLHRDIAMWNAYALPAFTIAINLSVSQLDAQELTQCFPPLAKKDFLGERKLVVEIREEAIAPIPGARFMTLARLHEMGIGLHLEHFGCNVLPLSTLCSLPFEMIKMDISLIKAMSTRAADNVMVSSAIILAHHLGMKVAAVGVEELWQAQALKAQGCDTAQGHFIAYPMTAEQLVEWL